MKSKFKNVTNKNSNNKKKNDNKVNNNPNNNNNKNGNNNNQNINNTPNTTTNSDPNKINIVTTSNKKINIQLKPKTTSNTSPNNSSNNDINTNNNNTNNNSNNNLNVPSTTNTTSSTSPSDKKQINIQYKTGVERSIFTPNNTNNNNNTPINTNTSTNQDTSNKSNNSSDNVPSTQSTNTNTNNTPLPQTSPSINKKITIVKRRTDSTNNPINNTNNTINNISNEKSTSDESNTNKDNNENTKKEDQNTQERSNDKWDNRDRREHRDNRDNRFNNDKRRDFHHRDNNNRDRDNFNNSRDNNRNNFNNSRDNNNRERDNHNYRDNRNNNNRDNNRNNFNNSRDNNNRERDNFNNSRDNNNQNNDNNNRDRDNHNHSNKNNNRRDHNNRGGYNNNNNNNRGDYKGKCVKAEKRECESLYCKSSHNLCKSGLDCNKKQCNYIHLPASEKNPVSRMECLQYMRILQHTRQQAIVNPRKYVFDRVTFIEFKTKLESESFEDILENLRPDLNWTRFAKAFESTHHMPEKFSDPKMLEEDLAQIFESLFDDVLEHFFSHANEFSLVKQDNEDEDEDEDEEKEDDDELFFDDKKIDIMLKNSIGKTFKEILKDFRELEEAKKKFRVKRVWEHLFLSRLSKPIISMSEEEAEVFLDNLISFVEEGSIVHENKIYEDSFHIDENYLNYSVGLEAERVNKWKAFCKGKKVEDLIETFNKNMGTTPIVSGFYAFPNLLKGIKFEMDAFCFLHQDHSLKKQVELVSKHYAKMPWIFKFAEDLDEEDNFHVHGKIENTYYGILYKEFKEIIQETWK